MKAVILAGGFGTRISEESQFKPKPMIEIGDMPILWHIMKEYYACGIDEFIICAGYKQQVIKDWFAQYPLRISDVTFDFTNGNQTVIEKNRTEKWKVTIVDTGLNTLTGGRIKRIEDYIKEDTFLLTYGDAVSDVDIKEVLKFHKENRKILTITSVNMSQNKGVIEIDDNGGILSFREKDDNDRTLINGGYMVADRRIFDYLKDDSSNLEKEVMEKLVQEREVMGYYHKGFWQCMDTKREKEALERLWNSGKAPWKTWED